MVGSEHSSKAEASGFIHSLCLVSTSAMASIMGAPPLLRSLLLGLCMVLLTFNFSIATQQTESIVAVVGNGECLDCAQKSIEKEEAFKGLHVAIQCKTGNGFHETKGVGLLDKSGSFEVQLPSDVLRDDGELKDECFAQLRSASEAPCPDNNGLDQSKVVLKSKEPGKHTFVVAAGKLPFSSTCTSAFHSKFHPFHKHLLKFKHKFDFHHHDFLHKPIIKKKFPPIPIYKKPIPPLPPVHKLPIIKKKFPPIPIHKKPIPPIPKPPLLYHPHPKFPPIYKKPLHPFYHPHPKFLFPPKPKFFKKKHPIFPPVKEHPIP